MKKHPSSPRNIKPSQAIREKRPPFNKKNSSMPSEMKFYGYHACMNLWKSRPSDIVKVYIEQRHVKEASSLLKWCASKNKAYHIISPEEMEKVSQSVHHEGLCVIAREVLPVNISDLLKKLQSSKGPECLLYLDGVQNPHNIGSIMRVCAHFGITHIVGEKSSLPNISPSTYRIAQGGAEIVKLSPIDDIKKTFCALKDLGFTVVASSCHGGRSLYNYTFSQRIIIIMGSESHGIKNQLFPYVKDTLMIPGSGLVESLNVSVATGLFLGEYYRQTHAHE